MKKLREVKIFIQSFLLAYNDDLINFFAILLLLLYLAFCV